MARCDLCKQFDDCAFRSDPDAQCSAFKQKPMTNGDRIRNMTDEELAEYLATCEIKTYEFITKKVGIGMVCDTAKITKQWVDWLKQEATDDT